MAGIYFHIPFCKQACFYCDFHFSTSTKYQEAMLAAMHRELELRKHEIISPIETIYFGGGTPSLLTSEAISGFIAAVYKNFSVADHPEITLEANPDDLDIGKIEALAATPINRFSVGVQSFFEEDLKLMNRAHTATEAIDSLKQLKKYFSNISIDLIYGVPNMSKERWVQNIDIALCLDIPHISSYALTIEPNTALKTLIKNGKIPSLDEAMAHEHFLLLLEKTKGGGYVHYELSNFGKPEYFSRHNTSYWLGREYLGIGPSAHSFNKRERSWNVSNNRKYITALTQGILPSEKEMLSTTDLYNEYVMTGLRTIYGVELARILKEFGAKYHQYIRNRMLKHIENKTLELDNLDVLRVSAKGKFLTDGIASDLFYL